MDRSAFKPTVGKPSYGTIYGFARTQDTADVKAWNVAPLGGTRFVTVVSGRAKMGKTYWFRLLVLQKTGAKWSKALELVLDTPADSTLPKGGKVGASVRLDDFDHDGKPEAQVRYRYAAGAQGNGEVRKLALVNLDGPKPRLALLVELSHSCEGCEGKRKSVVRFRDTNGDAHPDLQLNFIAEAFGGPGTLKHWRGKTWLAERLDVTYLWDWKTDTYKPAKPLPPRLPPSMLIGLRRMSMECLALDCLDAWGFPGVSADGKRIAVLADWPVYTSWSATPYQTDWSGVSFDLLRVRDAKKLKSIELIDSTDLSDSVETTRDQSCVNGTLSGHGDMRLCEQDKNLFPIMFPPIKERIQKRAWNIARALKGQRFTQLFIVNKPTKELPGPKQGLILKTRDLPKGVEVQLVKRPAGKTVFKRVVALPGKLGIIEQGIAVWVHPATRLVLIRMVGTVDPPNSDFKSGYVIDKLPTTAVVRPSPPARKP
ncbi:MAG: hypothetical protein ABI333_28310 [bacterium]